MPAAWARPATGPRLLASVRPRASRTAVRCTLSGCHSRRCRCTRSCSRGSRTSASSARRRFKPTRFPPALAGRDVLACAMTGSGKTVAFLLPILHQLMDAAARARRARWSLTPTRELAAQILEDAQRRRRAHADHRRGGLRRRRHGPAGARVPQRRRRHHRHARPAARSLPRSPYAKLTGVEYLVLDEADRMLDMGFLPDIRRVLRHLPERRQTLFFSATMPPPIAALTREMLQRSGDDQPAAPVGAGGRDHAGRLPGARSDLKSALLLALLRSGEMQEALVFTRTKHRANRLAEYLVGAGHRRRAHSRQPLAGRSARRRSPASSRAVPRARRDRHRGARHRRRSARPRRQLRRARGARRLHPPRRPHGARGSDGRRVHVRLAGGRGDLQAIERAVGKRLPRVTLPDFDYAARADSLEIPLAQRIAAIRQRRAAERPRSHGRTVPEPPFWVTRAPGLRPRRAPAAAS